MTVVSQQVPLRGRTVGDIAATMPGQRLRDRISGEMR